MYFRRNSFTHPSTLSHYAGLRAPLTIVTGRGAHSKGGKARIKEAVENLLRGMGRAFDSLQGSVVVRV